MDEEPETPIEIVPTKPVEIPQTSEGPRKRRIKVPAGRTDLPLVRKIKAMQSKASTSPSQPKSPTPKSTPKPCRKSFRLASQSTPRTSQPAGPSEQQPTLIEEIVPSPESSPVREKRKAPAEQGSPQVSYAQTPATNKGKGPAEQSLKPTPPTSKTHSKTTSSKRKVSLKQVPNQGPTEDEPVEPSCKKARKANPPPQNLPNFFKEVW